MKFLFERLSSSSLCVGWAALFYCGTTWAGTTWAFHIIIFIVTRSKKYPESSLDQQVAQASGA